MPSSADTVPQAALTAILRPKWLTTRSRMQRRSDQPRWGRTLLMGLAGLFFLGIFFAISWRTLVYLRSVPEIGPLLASKLLAMAFLAFGAILLISNVIASLSTFFLAKDLDILMSAPLERTRFYLARLTETIVHSSWMVALLMLPILTAYGVVWGGGPLFPLVVLGALLPFFVIPATVGTVITVVLVNVFPARRARDLLALVLLLAVGALVVVLRFVRPEQLARPEGYASLVDFIAVLRTPSHPLLPSEWAGGMLMNWLMHVGDPLPIALLWSTAGAFVVLGGMIHARFHTVGFSRAQEGSDQSRHGTTWPTVLRRLLSRVRPLTREFIIKDITVFLRDATQWSQLILLGVLVMVYLYNVQSLPLYSGERLPFFMITMIVFANQGLSGFVIAAVAARFIFPSISLEGRQLWLLRSAPLDTRAMLLSKYLVGMVPLLTLAMILTIATNRLLQVSGFMMWLSVGTVTLYTLAVGGLALGIGALYPQFDTENAAQIPTSYGGLVFMLLAVGLLGLILLLEALPVRLHLLAEQDRVATHLGLLEWGCLLAAALLCLAVGTLPLRSGLQRLRELEV